MKLTCFLFVLIVFVFSRSWVGDALGCAWTLSTEMAGTRTRSHGWCARLVPKRATPWWLCRLVTGWSPKAVPGSPVLLSGCWSPLDGVVRWSSSGRPRKRCPLFTFLHSPYLSSCLILVLPPPARPSSANVPVPIRPSYLPY